MGYYMFNAKYIESQYRKSSSTASLFIGSASFVPIALGIFSGGLFISICKPKMKMFFIFLFLTEFVSIFTIGAGMFLGCDPIDLVGQPTDNGTYVIIIILNCDIIIIIIIITVIYFNQNVINIAIVLLECSLLYAKLKLNEHISLPVMLVVLH